MAQNIYSDKITEEEKVFGFEVVETANPRGFFAMEPRKVKAVVFTLNPTDRIIKVNNHLRGVVGYLLERFGHYEFQKSEQAKWHPISTSGAYPNPEMARQAHQIQCDPNPVIPTPQITPVEPGSKY